MRYYPIKYIILVVLSISIGLAEKRVVKVGDKAPPISLFKLESNKYFRSKEFLGKKNLVVSFFATWCGPCAQEIPELIKMSKEFGDDFHFILADIEEDQEKVKKYVSKKDITLQVILDSYGVIFERYGGTELPLTVVVDKKGEITYYQSGYKKGYEKKLRNHLKDL